MAGASILGWLFGGGWWSGGMLVPTSLTFAFLYFCALRIRSGLTLAGLFFVGPLVAGGYFGLLLAFADPDPGCTQECWGRLGLAYIAGLVLASWEAGLLIGTIYRFFAQLLRASGPS